MFQICRQIWIRGFQLQNERIPCFRGIMAGVSFRPWKHLSIFQFGNVLFECTRVESKL